MSDLQERQSGSSPETTPKCPRCGDMFYDPKVVIQDMKQHAAEWEDQWRMELNARKHNEEEVTRLKTWIVHCIQYGRVPAGYMIEGLNVNWDEWRRQQCWYRRFGRWLSTFRARSR